MDKFIKCKEEASVVLKKVEERFAKISNIKVKVGIFCSTDPSFLPYEKMIYKNLARFKNLEIVKFSYDLTKVKNENLLFEEIKQKLTNANQDAHINGIFVESYIQKFLRRFGTNYYEFISPDKDIEALHPANLGRILYNEREHLPPTVKSILHIMEKVKEDLKGEKVVIVNHSEVVGKPLAMVLLQSKTNAPTVCICHIATKDLAAQTSQADFLITAIGKANFFTAEYIKEGAIVIDVGINSVNGKIYGDVDLKSVYDKVSLITPVPGGVGELTLAYFFYNITLCLKKQGMLKETKQ